MHKPYRLQPVSADMLPVSTGLTGHGFLRNEAY